MICFNETNVVHLKDINHLIINHMKHELSFVEIETITEDKYYHPIISINKDYFLQIVDKCRSIELRQYFVNGIQVRSFGYDFCKESGIEIITIARIDSEIEIIKN